MINYIVPCLWFDKQAEEAANFYTSLFNNSKTGNISRYGKEGSEVHGQKEGTALTVSFQLNGQWFTGLNGGPLFKFNPSISFYVVCETAKEVNFLWENLLEGGSEMMPLNKYDWSERYGWLSDRFGVSWQIALDKPENTSQKFSPALLFMGSLHPQAEEAVYFYTSIFPDSGVKGILKYRADENEQEGSVKHAQFQLNNQTFMIMGNSMPNVFNFNESVSFQVFCETQEEIDYYWSKLSDGGSEGQCGWLKDKYGVSWQVVPRVLGELMSNPEKSGRVIKAFMQMQKFDLEILMNA
jgi:predicted 3-demethylubiquinone-9 3-methyltransferase (glyoxalase superfamily)